MPKSKKSTEAAEAAYHRGDTGSLPRLDPSEKTLDPVHVARRVLEGCARDLLEFSSNPDQIRAFTELFEKVQSTKVLEDLRKDVDEVKAALALIGNKIQFEDAFGSQRWKRQQPSSPLKQEPIT